MDDQPPFDPKSLSGGPLDHLLLRDRRSPEERQAAGMRETRRRRGRTRGGHQAVQWWLAINDDDFLP